MANTPHFHIVTLFPESFDSYFGSSIIGRAVKDKKIKISFYNPRDYTKDPRTTARPANSRRAGYGAGKWGRVDQKPYGGGPGMVMEPESVLRAAEKAVGKKKDVEVIFFDASGKEFTNTKARALAKNKKHIVFICGHYEGIDARVQKILKAKKVSIGEYVLTGGELPAMVVIDAVSRQVPGVLGKYESLEEERVSSSEVYTRPEVLQWKGKKYRVPKVLLSGHHANINKWKQRKKK